MNIGENIRRKRLEYDIEQQELAKRIGVTNSCICQYEKGNRCPNAEILFKIAETLHCSLDELFGKKVS